MKGTLSYVIVYLSFFLPFSRLTRVHNCSYVINKPMKQMKQS